MGAGLPGRHRLRSAVLLGVLLVFVAGAVAAAPMGADEARRLLIRTSFYAPPGEVAALARLSRAEAVERLLDSVRTAPSTEPPAELDLWTPRSRIRAMSEQERREWLRHTIQQGQDLRVWWFHELLVTPSPFTERMTLFWHNHFVSSLRKVRPTRLMYRQNLLLRRHALGSFREMLLAVARDPAMIVYLDNASNRKGQPNENFAREVMELFTLGEGRYGEEDVKQAARAFTGWGIDGESGEFLFRPAWHDEGVKTILGRSGAFGGDEVLGILLDQPQTAELVVAKLWREFVSPQPDANEARRIAQRFRASGYDIRTAMRLLLTADAFYAEENRGALVKSPVDLLVGTVRAFGMELGDAYPLVVMSRRLGQDVMAPPNVKGWPGGEAWINAGTLLARKQILERLFRSIDAVAAADASESRLPMTAKMPMASSAQRLPDAQAMPAAQAGTPMQPEPALQSAPVGRYQRGMQSLRFDPVAWRDRWAQGRDEAIGAGMLPAPPVNGFPVEPQDRPALVRRLALDPMYQLK